WSADAAGAEAHLETLEAANFCGRVLDVGRGAARAGIAALEGRSVDAFNAYREVLRGYRALGLAFEEAAAAVDMVTVMAPSERDHPDVIAAVAAARETLSKLDARPFLTQLDAAMARPRADAPSRPPATVE